MRDGTFSKRFKVTLASGKEITAEVESVWSHETDYGADADGNRGIGADFIDDWYLTVPIDSPQWEVDDNGYPLTQNEKIEAESLLLEKAENDEWEERFEHGDDYYKEG